MSTRLALGAAGVLAGLAAIGRRGGSRSRRVWTVTDTEHLLSAIRKLQVPASRWAHVAAAQYKLALLDAYDELTPSEQQALEKATALTWMDEGAPLPRPLFRRPSAYEREHAGAHPGGLSLSRRPDLGHAYVQPDDTTRVFLVYPRQVALDSLVPNQRFDSGWHERFDEWDPPGYDWRTGRPTHRRGRMTPGELRLFGRSPLYTDQYGVEDEVILRREAHPDEISWSEYIRRSVGGIR